MLQTLTLTPARKKAAPLRSRWTAALAVGGSAIALVAAIPTGPAGAVTQLDSGPIPPGVTLSGVINHGPASSTAAFGSWRSEPVKVVTDFLGGNSWSAIANTSWTRYRWAGTNYHYVWSMFMLPSDGSGSMSSGAAGAYNGYFRQAAQGLVASGFGYSTIRLGWENTGNWYRWAALRNPGAYAAYWRQIVTSMRSVPGAHFTFDFNISNQYKDPRPAYPGDGYVDYISGDFYDESWGPYGAQNHGAVWNEITNSPYGLNWLASWASSHRKRLSMPEWALVYRCDGHGGGDDPSFVSNMRNWIASHDVAYETYFDDEDNSCQTFRVNGGHFPSAASRYKAVFGNAFTRTSTASVTTNSGLYASAAADRTNAWTLTGSTISGDRYIFERIPSTSARVQFVLDGRTIRTEYSAPYDLMGGTSGAAYPLHTSSLWVGTHTIKAIVSGAVNRTDTATFTVRR